MTENIRVNYHSLDNKLDSETTNNMFNPVYWQKAQWNILCGTEMLKQM